MLLVLFFRVSFHTDENAGKRSAWGLSKEKTGEEIRGTDRKYTDKLRKGGQVKCVGERRMDIPVRVTECRWERKNQEG